MARTTRRSENGSFRLSDLLHYWNQFSEVFILLSPNTIVLPNFYSYYLSSFLICFAAHTYVQIKWCERKKETLEMIVLCRSMELIFAFGMLEENSTVSSTMHRDYDMRLLFAFWVESVCGSMARLSQESTMISPSFGVQSCTSLRKARELKQTMDTMVKLPTLSSVQGLLQVKRI